MKSLIKYLSIIILSSTPTFAMDSEDSFLNGFSEFVERALATYAVPGASIAIVQNNKVLMEKGFGHADIKNQIPVTKDTLFGIGSISKTFTALLALQLQDQGKLNLSQTVLSAFPDLWPRLDLYQSNEFKKVEIKHLLNHTSGFINGNAVWYLTEYSRESLIDLIPLSAKGISSFTPPGREFAYDNVMYTLAGYIAGKALQMSYEAALEKYLLRPLNMTQTTASIKDKAGLLSSPYRLNDTNVPVPIPLRNLDSIAPSGGLNSSATDMAKFLLALVNKGKISGQSVIKEEIFDCFTKEDIRVSQTRNPFGTDYSEYGLGFYIGKFNDQVILGHGGNVDGFSSFFAILPKHNLGIVVLTNLDESEVPEIVVNEFFDRFLCNNGEDRIEKYLKSNAAKSSDPIVTEEKKKFALPDSHFAGSYNNLAIGKAEIISMGDDLQLVINKKLFRLFRKGENEFIVRTFDLSVPNSKNCLSLTANLGVNNQVWGITISDDMKDISEMFISDTFDFSSVRWGK